MYFPIEIWEQIFLYMDPVELTRLKRVCQSFKEIIGKTLTVYDHWYRKCRKEIPQHLWSSYYEKINPNRTNLDYHKIRDVQTFMRMYKLSLQCKNLTKSTESVNCFKLLPKHRTSEYNTCITVSDNLLVIGTSEGFIYLYEMYSSNAVRFRLKLDHKECIRNVQVSRDGKEPIVVSCSISDHINFWSSSSGELIKSKTGRHICTSFGYRYYAREFNLFIEGTEIPDEAIAINSEAIVAVGADRDVVAVYNERGDYWKINGSFEEGTCSYEFIEPPNNRIRHYYTFKTDLMACITESGYLGFVVRKGNWKLYNMLPFLHGVPTVVLIYTHLLIIGLDSGNIHIYYVEDFENIKFSDAEFKKICLEPTAVISLDISVYRDNLLLTVSHARNIYTVNFF